MYYIVDSSTSEFDYRPDDNYLNAFVYKECCRNCGNRFRSDHPIDIKIIADRLPLVVGGFDHPNINFARRDFFESIFQGEPPPFYFGKVIGRDGKPIDGIVTYVSPRKLVPIRGTNPLEATHCEGCGRKLFVPFPRSKELYVVARHGLKQDVSESSEGTLILSEEAVSRVPPTLRQDLRFTPIAVRESGSDGVCDSDLEF